MFYFETATNSPGTSFVTRSLNTYTLASDTVAHEIHVSVINAASEDNHWYADFDGSVVGKIIMSVEVTNSTGVITLSPNVVKGIGINPFYSPSC